MRELVAWINDQQVGTWHVRRDGHHLFDYAPSWLAQAQARPISLSLPLTADKPLEGAVVKNYFDNLLPDSEGIRQRLCTRLKLTQTDIFAMLQAIGRDCVGALQLLPPGETPAPVGHLSYNVLSGSQLEAHLASLGDASTPDPLVDTGYRLTIGGAQEKTALLRVGQQWCHPLGSTPTTHILKPTIGVTPGRQLDLRRSVENEWLCSQILAQLKLPVAHCEIADFGDRRVLVVERFDRQWQEGPWITRLVQEDLCQALGVGSDTKYEAKGGPGMQDCLEVLKGSVSAQQDGRTFLCAQLLFWLLGAIDGHAKNYSLFHLPGGGYRMTPLYDVISAWPLIGTGPYDIAYKKAKLSMAVRSRTAHYRLSEVQRRHWEQLAQTSGVQDAWPAMLEMVQRIDAALLAVEQALPPDFPMAMAQSIFAGTRAHLRKFNKAQGYND
ncbi:type II toxin-antitoxin system HipA family toxin [Rhodoferax fermentans]|uniref:Toxin HipA n=1 Tax=Rhodoferax fermentans TaxID=28066 RepID=A0A1T1ATK7_RHOFE|nr:type II toxin-antitoxin system HipA family toxin [Rhodoferax fermentans]MBK1684991.1 type II toxin-antitoxin system HipA family toxin [Rhodoferax fermentans]OOV07446.1 toxin HipA [Rhodoferax fermentans]